LRQRHRADDLGAVAVAALIVRRHAEATIEMPRQPFPRLAGTRHAVNRQHERAAVAPPFERRRGAVVEPDAPLRHAWVTCLCSSCRSSSELSVTASLTPLFFRPMAARIRAAVSGEWL